MNSKDSWHQILMVTAAVGTSIVASYSLLNSQVGNQSVANFSFPESVPLADWQHTGSETLKIQHQDSLDETESDSTTNNIQGGNRYRYSKQNKTIAIDTYYLTFTRGDIEPLLTNYRGIEPSTLQEQKNIETPEGFYHLARDSDRTYISGCLNAHGETTVTSKQFSASLNRHQMNLKLLQDWLLGKASIRDRRCLWITISALNDTQSLSESAELLSPAWQDFLSWWTIHFPTL